MELVPSVCVCVSVNALTAELTQNLVETLTLIISHMCLKVKAVGHVHLEKQIKMQLECDLLELACDVQGSEEMTTNNVSNKP